MRPKNFPLLLLPITIFGALFYFYTQNKNQKISERKERNRTEIIQSSQDQQFQKFNLTGFDDKGKTSWNLQGDTAKVDPGQTVYLDQNVTLRLRDNTFVRTDRVQWSQDGGSLRTDSLVHVDHQNAKVTGLGAYGRPNEGFLQLNRDIDMIILPNTHLTCEGPLKIFYNQNIMTFYRRVKVTDNKGTLTANRMDVHFDPTEKRIKEIVATGNVIIVRDQDTTHSKRAIYSVDTGSIRLEGNPEITLNQGGRGLIDGTLRN
jgi:uncharacterized protein YxeA